MVTNASIPGKYKPKKGNSDVATPVPASSEKPEAGNKASGGDGEKAAE